MAIVIRCPSVRPTAEREVDYVITKWHTSALVAVTVVRPAAATTPRLREFGSLPEVEGGAASECGIRGKPRMHIAHLLSDSILYTYTHTLVTTLFIMYCVCGGLYGVYNPGIAETPGMCDENETFAFLPAKQGFHSGCVQSVKATVNAYVQLAEQNRSLPHMHFAVIQLCSGQSAVSVRSSRRSAKRRARGLRGT